MSPARQIAIRATVDRADYEFTDEELGVRAGRSTRTFRSRGSPVKRPEPAAPRPAATTPRPAARTAPRSASKSRPRRKPTDVDAPPPPPPPPPRWAVITGAGSGIGAALAEHLCGRGVSVVGVGRRADALARTAAACAPGAFVAVAGDVNAAATRAAVVAAVGEAALAFLVHNAAVVSSVNNPFNRRSERVAWPISWA